MRHLAAAALGLALTLPAVGDPPSGRYVSFTACPIARDTGPDTDVCFVAEYEGERYALANPPDWGVPQLHHRVLVEGVGKDGALVCGATPLEGRASVMPEIDAQCGEILPDDAQVKGAGGGVFNSGTAQQRAYAQELARRATEDPRASIEPAILDPPPSAPSAPPYAPRQLSLIYPFGSTRAAGPDMIKVREIAQFARTAKVHRVTVIGYRAASLLSDGSELQEGADLARSRAEKIGAILTRLGVGSKVLRVSWIGQAIPGTGREDWRNRRVDISVEP